MSYPDLSYVINGVIDVKLLTNTSAVYSPLGEAVTITLLTSGSATQSADVSELASYLFYETVGDYTRLTGVAPNETGLIRVGVKATGYTLSAITSFALRFTGARPSH